MAPSEIITYIFTANAQIAQRRSHITLPVLYTKVPYAIPTRVTLCPVTGIYFRCVWLTSSFWYVCLIRSHHDYALTSTRQPRIGHAFRHWRIITKEVSCLSLSPLQLQCEPNSGDPRGCIHVFSNSSEPALLNQTTAFILPQALAISQIVLPAGCCVSCQAFLAPSFHTGLLSGALSSAVNRSASFFHHCQLD